MIHLYPLIKASITVRGEDGQLFFRISVSNRKGAQENEHKIMYGRKLHSDRRYSILMLILGSSLATSPILSPF